MNMRGEESDVPDSLSERNKREKKLETNAAFRQTTAGLRGVIDNNKKRNADFFQMETVSRIKFANRKLLARGESVSVTTGLNESDGATPKLASSSGEHTRHSASVSLTSKSTRSTGNTIIQRKPAMASERVCKRMS